MGAAMGIGAAHNVVKVWETLLAEALALQWKEARSIKDYATADDIRTTLRAVGIDLPGDGG